MWDGPVKYIQYRPQTSCRAYSLGEVDLPARPPAWSLIEICHPLLSQQFNMMRKPDCEDGLVVRSRSPVQVEDGVFRADESEYDDSLC